MEKEHHFTTVEPMGYYKEGEISEKLAYIRGAIEKYVHYTDVHEELFNYIKKLVNE